MEYFLEINGRKTGPFDAVAMMRKIRGGRVKRTDVVWLGWSGDRVSAFDVPDFHEFFDEYDDLRLQQEMKAVVPMLPTIKDMLVSALDLVMQNLVILVFTGVFLAVAFGGAALLSVIPVLGSALSGVWFFIVLALYQIVLLRKNRMQLVTPDFIVTVFKRFGVHIAIAASIIGVLVLGLPALLAQLADMPLLMMLVLLPGSLVWMVFYFAPLLVVDRGLKGFSALGYSVNMMRRVGGQNLITFYTLLIINYIVAPTGLLLVISLPLTMLAISDMYDNFFNQFEA